MSNIDWDFILEQEGFELQGKVPDAKGSKSGVTIASGFDLGQRTIDDLKGLPQSIIDKLAPFLFLKGAEAQAIASNLNVTSDEANIINKFAKNEALTNLKTKWESTTGTSFDDLDQGKATVLASVAFQYGDLETATPNFWKQTTSGDWNAASVNLQDFGDRYKTRRLNEARYLMQFAKKKQIDELTEPERIKAVESITTFDEDQFRKNAEAIGNLAFTEENQQQIKEQVDFSIQNIIDGLKSYSESAKEGKADLDKLIEERQDTVDAIELQRIEEQKLITSNPDLVNQAIEKNNKDIESLTSIDWLDGHKNPSFLQATPSAGITDLEQFQIDKANEKQRELLSTKYGLLDVAKAAIDQEWITSWLLKQANREELDPDPQFEDMILTKEKLEQYTEGIHKDYWDSFEVVQSHAAALRMRERILDVQRKEEILNSHGIATGITARLLAAVLDPSAWAVAIATDGIAAPAIIMNKANRLQRIIRGGLAAATTNAAIEGYLVSQNETLGTRELLIATAAGFILGGTLRGIRRTRISDDADNTNEYMMNDAVEKFKRIKEAETVEDADLSSTSKGKKHFNDKDSEVEDFEKGKHKDDFDLDDATTVRVSDGNVEVKMPDGKTEYIVKKNDDGSSTVMKCNGKIKPKVKVKAKIKKV